MCHQHIKCNRTAKFQRVNRTCLAALVPLVIAAASMSACTSASQTPSRSTPAATPSAASSSVLAPPQTQAAPSVISLPLSLAEKKIRVNAIDVGQHIVDGVDKERAIFDRTNWRIVAQCEQTAGGTLTVGVIKSAEFLVIQNAEQGASIADNSLSHLLNCP
ncbi:hypothetical protein SEA_AMGINE_36 [Mycobacterium phage Amgine]|uniref:Uncharacterized protein n=1 Tax=Mycobacterium phage Amgine TaxID=2015817 RepID=A0A222ZLN2_9CAUD|nr:hypothetical protein I5G84_gp36 [Mycobacterium phage Amgine]ASR85637.1 hypothetical protein SEA_AMGINE_36 [Mycobacterium phage Amgine]